MEEIVFPKLVKSKILNYLYPEESLWDYLLRLKYEYFNFDLDKKEYVLKDDLIERYEEEYWNLMDFEFSELLPGAKLVLNHDDLSSYV